MPLAPTLRTSVATAFVACTFGAHAYAQSVVSFADGTFAAADWQLQSVVLDGSPTATAAQLVGGGNPGDARRVTLTTTTQLDIITAYSLFGNTQGTRYVPSTQGAIASLSFALQGRSATGDRTQVVYAALRQGNNFFVALGTVLAPSGAWQTIQGSGLTAASFFNLGAGPSAPDFSASGAPIRVGFATRTGGTVVPGNFVAEYDNFFVDITPVPGPGAIALLGVGAVCARRRWR